MDKKNIKSNIKNRKAKKIDFRNLNKKEFL